MILEACYSSERTARDSCLLRAHTPAGDTDPKPQNFKKAWVDFPSGSVVKNPPANAGDMGLIPGSGRSSGREDPLEEEMVTRSSILAWRILWTEEPGGLQSTGSQSIEHNWSDLAHCYNDSILLLIIINLLLSIIHELNFILGMYKYI